MLEILKSPKHLVAFKLSGELTANDVERSTNALIDALKTQERVSIFAEIGEPFSLTLEGLWKDLVNSFNNFGIRKKVFRLAVVSPSEVYSAILRIEGFVLSSTAMRVFTPEQREEAFAWASKKPEPMPKPEPAKRAIRFIQTTNENVFAYEVDGRVIDADVKETAAELHGLFERKEKANVIALIRDFGGFELSALLRDDLVRVKIQSLSKVERYAVVGAPTWMRNLLELLDPALKMKIRVFEPEQEQDAWDWVGASQALLAKGS